MDTPEPAAHQFLPTMGNRCAVGGCGRTRQQHDPNAPPAQPPPYTPMAEKACSRDHSALQTRQFPTPQGLEWAVCPECRVQLEAPAAKRA